MLQPISRHFLSLAAAQRPYLRHFTLQLSSRAMASSITPGKKYAWVTGCGYRGGRPEPAEPGRAVHLAILLACLMSATASSCSLLGPYQQDTLQANASCSRPWYKHEQRDIVSCSATAVKFHSERSFLDKKIFFVHWPSPRNGHAPLPLLQPRISQFCLNPVSPCSLFFWGVLHHVALLFFLSRYRYVVLGGGVAAGYAAEAFQQNGIGGVHVSFALLLTTAYLLDQC